MGVQHVVPPAARRAVPPRVDPDRARRPRSSPTSSAAMTADWSWVDPEDFFVAHVAHRPRSFWLDGSGSRAWSGRMTYVGWLEPDDISLDAARRRRSTVTAHTEHVERGRRRRHLRGADGPTSAEVQHADCASAGLGRLLRVCRAPRSAGAGRPEPSCPRRVLAAGRRAGSPSTTARRQVFAVAPPDGLDAWRDEVAELLAATPTAPPPREPDRGDDRRHLRARRPTPRPSSAVQAELRLGNSYETNLTFRTGSSSRGCDPVDAYRRLRAAEPRAVRRVRQARRHQRAEQLTGAVRHHRRGQGRRDAADQGHDARATPTPRGPAGRASG